MSQTLQSLKQRNRTPFITKNITNIIWETNNTIKYDKTHCKKGQGLASTNLGTGYLICLMPKQSKYSWYDLNQTQTYRSSYNIYSYNRSLMHWLLLTTNFSELHSSSGTAAWPLCRHLHSNALSATLTVENRTTLYTDRESPLLTTFITKVILLIGEKYPTTLTNI